MAGPTVYSRLRTTDFLRNFSWQFLFTLRVIARNPLGGNRRRNTFRISFWCLPWGSNLGFSSNKPTHYLLDHGDYINCLYFPKFIICYQTVLTYINGHYNPSVRIIDLVSHTTYVVCVNFIYKWRDLQFKVDSERHIFWETFHGNFIYSQSFCQKSAKRK